VRKSTSNKRARSRAAIGARRSESGFTMLEMVVALVVLLIGLLAMMAAIGYSLMVTNSGRGVTNTKLLVVSILEEMETMRNTGQLTYGQIANQGQVDPKGAKHPFGGFPPDFEPVSLNPGPDGIYGTGDDLVDAGTDGIYGTTDDFTNPALARQGFTRQILITPLSPNLKQVTVTLKYPGPNGQMHKQLGISYLNNDARNNY
jgi:prepilin-type N-terminal cleavage/methylation domain-containing protein